MKKQRKRLSRRGRLWLDGGLLLGLQALLWVLLDYPSLSWNRAFRRSLENALLPPADLEVLAPTPEYAAFSVALGVGNDMAYEAPIVRAGLGWKPMDPPLVGRGIAAHGFPLKDGAAVVPLYCQRSITWWWHIPEMGVILAVKQPDPSPEEATPQAVLVLRSRDENGAVLEESHPLLHRENRGGWDFYALDDSVVWEGLNNRSDDSHAWEIPIQDPAAKRYVNWIVQGYAVWANQPETKEAVESELGIWSEFQLLPTTPGAAE